MLKALLVFMSLDYLSGLTVAAVFHKSPKTENGRVESRAGLKGLVRKIGMLCLVAVAVVLDNLLGSDYLRSAVIVAFTVNELISLMENMGLMGIPLPKKLTDAMELLGQKEEQKGEER